jgi:glycosyltransferase involved in cell wall biosynthesis
VKICNVIQRYPPAVGGSETWCQEVCRHISKQGNDVSVLTLDVYDEEEFWRDPLPDNCTFRFGPCNFDGNIRVRRYKRSIPNHLVYHTVYKFLDKALGIYSYGPHSYEMYTKMYNEIKLSDIVHTHTIPYPHNFFSLMESKIARKKIVISPHFHPNHPHYERKAFYSMFNRCDAIITVSEFEKEYLIKKGIKSEKIFVSGNGVVPELYIAKDFEDFEESLKRYGIYENTKIVTFIGRKIDYKGVDLLIGAAKKLLQTRKDIKFLLVGPRLPWFNQLYSGLTIEEKEYIIDIGYVSTQEKVNILHRSDILCLPSKFEAFGIVFLEAWICNTAVIGSDQGAQPSVIGNEGLTFKFGDINDLAEKITYLIDNEEIAKRMARDGKIKVLQKYTWEKIGEQVLNVYNTVLET